ncbi:hypothetical protein GCM10023224_14060 [Streptomonospora halophila]|uniref:Uncharacterized protein n=1 Tax=Streptomonospora halophila TaxID=427369 RepID=A0ABP9GDL9_9ACTN
MNEIAGSPHTAIQVGSVHGNINVGRSGPPEVPVAVCAEAVEWSEFIAVEDEVEELLTCADTIEIVAQPREGAEVVIGAPHPRVVSRRRARKCFTPPPPPAYSALPPPHEYWIADLTIDPPEITPENGPRRYEFDLSAGVAESFLVHVDGWIDIEEDLCIDEEVRFKFVVDWMCEGRRGRVDVLGKFGEAFVWHPLTPELGVRYDLRQVQ